MALACQNFLAARVRTFWTNLVAGVPTYDPVFGSLVVVLFALFFTSTSMAQPSFDCKTNRKPDEVAVCSDLALSSLDREQAAIYTRLRADLSPELATTLRESQRSWLRSRRSCGSDRECLVGLYRDRIDALNKHASPQQHPNPNSARSAEVSPPLTLEEAQDPNRKETELILDVIANAFKCPIPVTTWEGYGFRGVEHVVHTFTGNATVLSFETRSTLITKTRTETLLRRSLPISKFGKATIVMNSYRSPTLPLLQFECGDRRVCIEERVQVLCEVNAEYGNGSKSCGTTKRQPMRKLGDAESGTDNVYICDKDTALILAEALTALRDKSREQRR